MPLPSLAEAGWLRDPAVQAVFAALDRDGDKVMIVGGAVRDALLGGVPREIDFATTAEPATVAERAAAAGLRAVPTGIEHGTVTLLAGGRSFEVTTLREDVETDGRHAVVRFGRDWDADAKRRDFTVNALYADAGGQVIDPVSGYPDLLARRIRFIGDPDRRISEDRLRILRFFRFHAQIGEGPLDRAGLGAAIRGRDAVRFLSPERVAAELRKLLLARRAVATLEAMQEAGILPVVLGGVGYLGSLARWCDLEATAGIAPAFALRMAALGCRIVEDAERIADRLRLANAERLLMTEAVAAVPTFGRALDPPGARAAIYRLGASTFLHGAVLAAAWRAPAAEAELAARVALARVWSRPSFPLGGGDVLALGVPAGPQVGKTLQELREWWIAEDFRPDRQALLERLSTMAAGRPIDAAR